jgi:hypothetical protein
MAKLVTLQVTENEQTEDALLDLSENMVLELCNSLTHFYRGV